jgi:hypothetical protein
MNLAVVFFRIRSQKTYVETSPVGLEQMNVFGKKIVIPWDEMGRVYADEGGYVRVKDKSGKRTINLAKFYKNFDQLKKRVFEESERKRIPGAKEAEVYGVTAKVGIVYLWGGLFILLMGLACVAGGVTTLLGYGVSKFNPLFSEIFFFISGSAYIALAVYCLGWGLKVKYSKIELTQLGIARLEKNRSRVFIKWEDVTRLTKRELMKQIGVYSLDPTKKIMVDYQFEGFEQIRDRVFKEFEKRLTLPVVATTYGPSWIHPNFALMGFRAVFIGFLCFIRFSQITTGDTTPLNFMIILFVFFYLIILNTESKGVKALILNGNEIVLRKLFGKTILQAREVDEITMDSIAGHNGTFYYRILLSARDGKKYIFTNELGTEVGVYLVLKKWLEKQR